MTFGCRSGNPDKAVGPPPNLPVIQPPLPGADVPFGNYIVDASKGDTIYAPSGSILYFPPQSFLDDKGKVITGKVTVRFREFADALDQYLAGIPMTYDSAGNKFQFVSSAMCEIKAIKDSLPVFVNPVHKPEVHLVTRDGNTHDNFYYFDTVQRDWKYKGGVTITDLRTTEKNTSAIPVVGEPMPAIPAPIMPGKITGNSPVLVVKIDSLSFGEISRFNNLRFQVNETLKKFDPKDSDEEWNDVELTRGKEPGTYIVKFTNAMREVSYTARPVLQGKDFEKAKEIYEQEYESFNQKLAAQRTKNKAAREKFVQDSLKQMATDKKEEEMATRLNALIEARNKSIDWQNAIIRKNNERIEAENKVTEKMNREKAERRKVMEVNNKLIEELNKATEKGIAEKKRTLQEEINKQIEEEKRSIAEGQKRVAEIQERYNRDFNNMQKLYRSFQIDGFGLWNCDAFMRLSFFPVTAFFKDGQGNKLYMLQIAGVVKNRNGIIQMGNQVVNLVKGTDMMIWGVVDGKFAYLDYETYHELGLTPEVKEFTFIMKLVPAGENTYQYLRALIKP